MLFHCACQSVYHVLPYFFMEVVWADVSFAGLMVLLVASNITSMVLDFLIDKVRRPLSSQLYRPLLAEQADAAARTARHPLATTTTYGRRWALAA